MRSNFWLLFLNQTQTLERVSAGELGQEIKIGLGIHSGDFIAGRIGSPMILVYPVTDIPLPGSSRPWGNNPHKGA